MRSPNEHVARLITARYWAALALIALMVTASQIVMSRTIETERAAAKVVGMAADQSFAAQRICFLSHAVVNAAVSGSNGLQVLRDNLQSVVDEMAKRHAILSLRRDTERIPPEMRTILRNAYYSDKSRPFDPQVNKLLKDARTILEATDGDLDYGMKPLARMTEAGSRTLVEKQRMIFDSLRAEARDAVNEIRVLGIVLWLITLVLLGATVPFIFRPLARRVALTMERVEAARQTARDQAALANEAHEGLARFIRTMSHELRTPLNAILGITQLMKLGIKPEKQKEYAQDIHQAGRHLLNLVNDILELSRLEAGQVTVEPAKTSLMAELEWTVSLLQPLAEEKELKLSFRLDPALADGYLADGPRIRQILINLLGNALKFTEAGTVTVAATRLGPVGENADLVRFEVVDTGIGVADEMKQRIFDEFQQADDSLESREGGSGLGLAICNRLVRLMNGEIGVESVVGCGSVFWFTLPLERLSEPCSQRP